MGILISSFGFLLMLTTVGVVSVDQAQAAALTPLAQNVQNAANVLALRAQDFDRGAASVSDVRASIETVRNTLSAIETQVGSSTSTRATVVYSCYVDNYYHQWYLQIAVLPELGQGQKVFFETQGQDRCDDLKSSVQGRIGTQIEGVKVFAGCGFSHYDNQFYYHLKAIRPSGEAELVQATRQSSWDECIAAAKNYNSQQQ